MTGHGQAHQTADGVQVWAEVRAVNNRYLKVTISYSDRIAELETQVKAILQKHIRRGSVHVNLEVQRDKNTASFRLNTDLLRALHEQLLTVDADARADSLLNLPGVVEEIPSGRESGDGSESAKIERAAILDAVEAAVSALVDMRQIEGASAARDLLDNCNEIQRFLSLIEDRAPHVSRGYSTRLTERISQLLEKHEATISPSDIVREVGIFADKCDISEEVVRLQTHIDQFAEIINSGQGDGRKLEFLSQEMLRETNTIGSKANDSEIAQNVVEIKTAIDRIREMTQNVE